MKKLIMLLCSLGLVFGVVDIVRAISYTDVFDANHLYMSAGTSKEWTFDITDPVSDNNDGFNPGTQDVTSASIFLNLEDDSKCDLWEIANLRVGENRFFWEVNSGSTSFSINSLVSLSDSGTVSARLTAIFGDFYFNGATLKAEATDPAGTSTPVPEPGTILLLGTGLMGLVVASRKKIKNNIFFQPKTVL
jgi:hypothetical protein